MDLEKLILEHLADKPVDLAEILLFLCSLALGIIVFLLGIWLAERSQKKKPPPR